MTAEESNLAQAHFKGTEVDSPGGSAKLIKPAGRQVAEVGDGDVRRTFPPSRLDAAHWLAIIADVEPCTAREWIRIGRLLCSLPATADAFLDLDPSVPIFDLVFASGASRPVLSHSEITASLKALRRVHVGGPVQGANQT